jgi:hypothetical protein
MVAISTPAPVERIVGAQHVAVYRDEQKILEKLRILGAAAGSDWMYRFPVSRKGGGQDWIEGPSIKLANDLARLYGNCEVETRVMDLGESWLIYARFTDIESGFSMTRPFQQRKGQRGMKTESDRGLDIAFQIGTSKAIRNVVVNSLQTFADFAFDEARNALVQKIGKDVDTWRQRTVKGLATKRVELARVERAMGRAAKDWTAPDIARVIAMMQSINDGMATVDETFPASAGSENAPEMTTSPTQEGRGGEEHVVSPTAEPAVTRSADQASGTAPASNQPENAQVSLAWEMGKKAKAAGHARKALPGQYRDKEAEAVAWYAGYDGLPLE